MKKPIYIILLLAGIVAIGAVVSATRISDLQSIFSSIRVTDGISMDSGSSLNASEINGIYYVYGDTATLTTINDTIKNNCDGIKFCYIKVIGNLTTSPIDLVSNMIIDFTDAKVITSGNFMEDESVNNVIIKGGAFHSTSTGARLYRFVNSRNITISDFSKIEDYNSLSMINTSYFEITRNKNIYTSWGMVVYNSSYGKISDNQIKNSTSTDAGIALYDGCHDILITNNEDNEGISIAGTYDTHPEYKPMSKIDIINNKIGVTKKIEDDGISIWGLSNSEISGNIIRNTTEDCIIIRSQQSMPSYGNSVKNNYCYYIGQDGLSISQQGGSVSNNYLYHITSRGALIGKSYTLLNPRLNSTQLTNNNFYYAGLNSGTGIWINRNNTEVSGNYLYMSGGYGIKVSGSLNHIIHNTIDTLKRTDTTTYAIIVDALSLNNTIIGNIIYSYNKSISRGIQLSGNNNDVLYNYLYRVTTDIKDDGTNNKINFNFYDGSIKMASNLTIYNGAVWKNCGINGSNIMVCT